MKSLVKISGFLITAFSSLLMLSISVNAANLPARGPIAFSVYDANGDGVISEQEFYDIRAQRIQQKVDQGMPMRNVGNSPDFKYFDTNGDGKLTETELLKGQNTMMQNRPNGPKGYGKGMMQQQ
ncbi:EF-hand domain-containing protein [Halarcobacter ebronensis]|nr:EF-hand domain-containing protein [Halarcobacter ebronensis]QKF83067.1 EF-hand domain-containing, calcium-binding protein [Halarcobacter ebronensis]